jgi:hypothetical protein
MISTGRARRSWDKPGHDGVKSPKSSNGLPHPFLYDMYHFISAREPAMADQTVTIAAAPREASSTVLQIAVLAALAATGTLATNILLPSLPQMAASLNVTSAAVTSAITIFLAVFALGQLVVGPVSDRYGRS